MDSWSTDLIIGTTLFVSFIIFLFYLHLYQTKTISSVSRAVLITGCDTGFGHQLAIRLNTEGYKVFAGCLDVNSEGARKLQSYSQTLTILQLDVTKSDQIEAAKVIVVNNLMGNVLWAVVNNAGLASHAQFEWLPKTTFERMIQVNLMGVVNVTREFLHLIRANKGRIINIASMAGRTAIPGFTAYSASKFAVIGFSDSLRREMKHFDVKVITIEPSLYKTGLSAHFVLQNDVFWSIAEPAVRRDYGGKFFSDTQVDLYHKPILLSRNRLLNRARKNIDEVIDCCVHSVTAAYPSKRYVRPRHLQIFNDFFNEMFLDFQDLILYYITGIYTKPDMMCHQNQDIEHHMLGRRRSYAT